MVSTEHIPLFVESISILDLINQFIVLVKITIIIVSR